MKKLTKGVTLDWSGPAKSVASLSLPQKALAVFQMFVVWLVGRTLKLMPQNQRSTHKRRRVYLTD